MNKKMIGLLLALSMLFMTSCSSANNSVPNETENGNEYTSTPSTSVPNNVNNTTEPTISGDPTRTEQGNTPIAPTASITTGTLAELNLDKIQGKIRNIVYADNNSVLIWADSLYLYDTNTGYVSAEAALEDFSTLSFWTITNGYVAVGMKRASTGNGFTASDEASYKCIFYDNSLKNVSEFDFTSLLDDKDEYLYVYDMVSFSSDGNKVVFAVDSGLYLYDFSKKEKTKIVDLKSEDAAVRSGIVLFSKIGFTNNDKSIAFWGNSFDVPAIVGKNGFDTIGTVNIDGSELSNNKIVNYIPQMLIIRDKYALLCEDTSNTTGKVQYVETSKGKITTYDLRDKSESQYICVSQDGRYFASAIIKNNSTDWIVRIYSTETGELENELTVSGSEQSIYTALNPRIMIFDDTRTCVIVLGVNQGDVKSKIVNFNF